MNHEREAKRAIRDEIEAFAHLGAGVAFRNGRNNRVLADISYRGQTRSVHFCRASHRMGAIKAILGDVRRELRALGLVARQHPVPPKIGTLGQVLQSAILDRVEPLGQAFGRRSGAGEDQGLDDAAPITGPRLPLCPDAIAAAHATPARPPLINPKPNGGPTMTSTATPATTTKNGSSTERARKIQLNHEQIIRITQLLMMNGSRSEAGAYVYKAGWSDEKVRDSVRKDCPVERIAEIRKEHFGRLGSEIRVALGTIPAKRFAALEAEVQDLKTRLEKAEIILAPLAAS